MIITTAHLFDTHVKAALIQLRNEMNERGVDTNDNEAMDTFAWNNKDVLGQIFYEIIGEQYGTLDDAHEELNT